MREILGERRTNGNGNGGGSGDGVQRRSLPLRGAALAFARRWGWPVVPGAEALDDGRCACGRADCPVPGAHPADPDLLAATTDARMVGWWWETRPQAPILLATGGRAPCAVSLPAVAGARADLELRRRGVAGAGPVIAAPTRWLLLVEPYELPELGELLAARELVPSSLRFHGPGGYVPLPPSATGAGEVGWVREPERARDRGRGAVALPSIGEMLDVLVEAGLSAPDREGRLSY
ncbi:bifunctional DNA primase/polymerase [Streptomyces millisiae]|uniref:Bifunctional DNA primase/polymerase n=1 Tax=Streptomyces millisiae TaxID=3075542 RepID=A0ABU2LKI6_9ACTN|nr:bifunctional DNA primase/polymerase [Streptomyces sp. DSM 44918]MDT0318099.1 bifunctional DNA primase/polymerase [Streptomyces sp. DSM 44918]